MDKNLFKKLEKGLTFKGDQNGPKSVILAGIHGNEICGIEAFKKILSNDLKIEKGEVTFVLGNPKAVKENKRFTKLNLNRCFKKENEFTEKEKKSYEYKRSIFLKNILKEKDFCLDIHSTKNPSEPFIICGNNKSYKIAQYFDKKFKRIVYDFGKIEPGATDDYMDSLGKNSITIECGQHLDPKAIKLAEKTILKFLQAKKHLKTKEKIKINKFEKIKIKTLYKNQYKNFILNKNFKDFTFIKKDTLIGFDGDNKIYSLKDCYILFAHNRQEANQEAFLLADKI